MSNWVKLKVGGLDGFKFPNLTGAPIVKDVKILKIWFPFFPLHHCNPFKTLILIGKEENLPIRGMEMKIFHHPVNILTCSIPQFHVRPCLHTLQEIEEPDTFSLLSWLLQFYIQFILSFNYFDQITCSEEG